MVAIPFCAPVLRLARYQPVIDHALQRVVRSGHYILGPEVATFERELAESLGGGHCIGVGNGTDAISLALMGLGIGAGDEVICPALTAHGSIVGILRAGAIPVFTEIDPASRCLDPDAVEQAISPRTAAILAVHLHGHPAAMPALCAMASRHRLAVVEDVAQSLGGHLNDRPLGTWGDAAAFSFYPTKNLGCLGDGGAVFTKDGAVAARLKRLRCYGWDAQRICHEAGMNSRLDEMQAAILRVMLPHLGEEVARRRTLAARYREALATCDLGLPGDAPGATYHQFAVTVSDRHHFRTWLDAGGIATDIHYPLGMHRMPAFPDARLPVTDQLAQDLVSLPIQPEIAEAHFDRIVGRIVNYWSQA